ncbi:unnamed protein product [Discosporangium mesarthrocarpum]
MTGILAFTGIHQTVRTPFPTGAVAEQAIHKTVRCPRRSLPLMAGSQLIGGDVETGGIWDPLGLATDETSLFRRRVAELKHGRVCMLATAGVFVQTFVHLPDPERSAFSNPRPLGALAQVWHERPMLLVAMVAVLGVLELTWGRQEYLDTEPGSLGGFWLELRPSGDQEWYDRRLQELKHGRLAMLSITGMLAQEMVTHEGPVEQLLNGHINPFVH